MKAAPFQYLKARTLEEVFDALDRHGDEAALLAGGQSLVPALNLRMARPAALVDINGLHELGGLALDGDLLRIGALARHAEVGASPLVARHAPLLALAMPHVAHRAVRERGTLGGSLAHADPAAELPACAVALDAKLLLRARGGPRTVAAAQFFRGVLDTDRRPGELLCAAHFPVARPDQVSGFAELSRRHGDFAIVGVAAAGRLTRGTPGGVRLVVFGCETHPRVSAAAAALLDGQAWSAPLADAVAAAVADELDPMDDQNGTAVTKRRQARVLVRRVLQQMYGGPGDA